MQRTGENNTPYALFNDAAQIHHCDAVTHMLNDTQIVRNHQKRDTEFIFQFQQQIDDLCADRHIEGGNGLVADKQFRLNNQGARNANTLSLAA
eukprot:TRINITY_DN34438_c0_g1_i1.p2 TRINITY_DN34438_c0_g1~~TRINITY_DN34438_c0_g1_i1.p2  ORF type:complete len:93 (+),score=0.29 TRINITY_DN34438_c0_g1_i1:157-435(+)